MTMVSRFPSISIVVPVPRATEGVDACRPIAARFAPQPRHYFPTRFAKKMSGLPRPFASGITPTTLKPRRR